MPTPPCTGLVATPLPTVKYYPEPFPTAPCEPEHRSFRGTYGSLHPMPYYLPNLPQPVVSYAGRMPPRQPVAYSNGAVVTIVRPEPAVVPVPAMPIPSSPPPAP